MKNKYGVLLYIEQQRQEGWGYTVIKHQLKRVIRHMKPTDVVQKNNLQHALDNFVSKKNFRSVRVFATSAFPSSGIFEQDRVEKSRNVKAAGKGTFFNQNNSSGTITKSQPQQHTNRPSDTTITVKPLPPLPSSTFSKKDAKPSNTGMFSKYEWRQQPPPPTMQCINLVAPHHAKFRLIQNNKSSTWTAPEPGRYCRPGDRIPTTSFKKVPK